MYLTQIFFKILKMRWSSQATISTCRRFANQRMQHKSNWTQPTGFLTKVKVYNPITKCNVPLILKHENIATWYICGPTVYDSAHIGHACTYMRFDIIRRILTKFFNINVVTIMGITDIDDKIIQRSLESKQNWKELTKKYEQEFFNEMDTLNIIPPYLYCRVTDYISQIIEFIKKIFDAKAAYIGKDGCVYFDTTKYNRYGKLYKPPPSEKHSVKNSTTDFALWKPSKPDEPFWESPWGPGRPGWHIECSTIASTTLGSTIDIHSGGIDLLFPHHENEETQSCSYHDIDQWVNYWLHSGHLYLPGDVKMSKSLKNAISIQDILKTYSPNQFRLFCLLTHYRTGIEFSHEKMQNAITILMKLEHFLSDCQYYVSGQLQVANIDEHLIIHTLHETKKKVYAALADDFDTTNALFAIQDLVATVNKMVNQTEVVKSTANRNTACIAAVAEYVRTTLSDLGISEGLATQGKQNELIEVIETFVKFRQTVRSTILSNPIKDESLLKACDEVRNNLSACGIKLKDHKNTSSWTFSEDSKACK